MKKVINRKGGQVNRGSGWLSTAREIQIQARFQIKSNRFSQASEANFSIGGIRCIRFGIRSSRIRISCMRSGMKRISNLFSFVFKGSRNIFWNTKNVAVLNRLQKHIDRRSWRTSCDHASNTTNLVYNRRSGDEKTEIAIKTTASD